MKLYAILFVLAALLCLTASSTAQKESRESEESIWDIFDDDDDDDSSETKLADVELKNAPLTADSSDMNNNYDFGKIFNDLAAKVQTFFNQTVGNILETVDNFCEELTSDEGKKIKKDEEKENAIANNTNTNTKPTAENPAKPDAGNIIVPPKGSVDGFVDGNDGSNGGESPPIGA